MWRSGAALLAVVLVSIPSQRVVVAAAAAEVMSAPRLLVLLADGVRAEYLSPEALAGGLPGLRALVEQGAAAPYVTPDFPTLSYPNYYSIMTGRHTETHGMTGNYMWNPKTNSSFLIGTNSESRDPAWWGGSEPLWITAEKTKGNVRMYYWPGCEVEVLNTSVSHCKAYTQSPTQQQVQEAVTDALLHLREGSSHMACVYYEEVDVEGHHYGPSSSHRFDAMKRLDEIIANMSSQIESMGLSDHVDVILVSDHGMMDIDWEEKLIEWSVLVSPAHIVKVMDKGAVVSVWPFSDKTQEVYEKLKLSTNMQVYKPHELPKKYHYGSGVYVAPITLVANPGWFIVQDRSQLPYWQNGTGVRQGVQKGWHGYDNALEEMRSVFVASGPSFKRNYVSKPLRIVDIYNVMCNVLEIEPKPNNGSWEDVRDMLKSHALPVNFAKVETVPLLTCLLCFVMFSH